MNLVLALMAGAVAKSVVPTVARAVADGEPARGQHSVRVALTVTVLAMLGASVVMAVVARPPITVVGPGFDAAATEEAGGVNRGGVGATPPIAAPDVLGRPAQGA